MLTPMPSDTRFTIKSNVSISIAGSMRKLVCPANGEGACLCCIPGQSAASAGSQIIFQAPSHPHFETRQGAEIARRYGNKIIRQSDA